MAALVVAAYANSLGNGFVWDDHQQIVMNPAVRAGTPLAPIFTGDVRFARQSQAVESSDYRPLQMLTYRLLVGGLGMDPEAFHTCSLGFAMGCSLAAFAVFRRLVRRPGVAFAAATLFAVYPVHAEAVDWIAALPELGCTLFLLLSFWAWLAASQPDAEPASRRAHWLWLAGAWLAFGVALLWKETALVFPVLLGVYLLLQAQRPLAGVRMALRQTTPFWAVLALYLGMRYAALGSLTAGPRDWQLSGLQPLCNWLYLMAAYWAKLALAVGLNAYYTFHPIRSLAEPRALAAVAFPLAALALGVLLWRRRAAFSTSATEQPPRTAPLALFAAAWVTITLLPAMDLAGLGRNAFTERYLYLPSAGFCLLLALAGAWLVARVPLQQRRVAACLLLAVALAGSLAETVQRNPDWKDDTTLFTATLARSPDAPFVRVMVANLQSGDPSQSAAAEENYESAIELARAQAPPDLLDAVTAYQGLASLQADRGSYPLALATLRQADAMVPGNADIEGEEGLILTRSGQGSAALPLLQQALATQPDDVNVIVALAAVERETLHDVAAAERLFERALALHTEDDEFAATQHNNLGAVFGDEDKYTQALAQFREAVRIQPSDPEYHLNLAIALATTGHPAEARVEAQTAAALAPSDPAPRQLLQDLSTSH